jgi:NAD-dependent dihydropyrimidine dehydrogenase PreA subunit
MAAQVLPVWSGERLTYVRPMAVITGLGYEPTYRNSPETDVVRERMFARVPEQDGPPAATPPADAPSDPIAATALVEAMADELGADDVGVAAVDPRYVYDGTGLDHRFAIMVAMAMDYETIAAAPSAATNGEVMRVYGALADLAIELARRIRAFGVPARAHTLAHEELAFIPHAIQAGLGELGKHGSLLHPRLGASFRLAAVTTDLPLVIGHPTSERVADLCRNCSLCVDHCPGDAISHEPVLVRGERRWLVDTDRCAPYWATYHACAICLQVCPWNARAGAGPIRELYIRTIKGLDRDGRRQALRAGVGGRVHPPTLELAPAPGSEAPTAPATPDRQQ